MRKNVFTLGNIEDVSIEKSFDNAKKLEDKIKQDLTMLYGTKTINSTESILEAIEQALNLSFANETYNNPLGNKHNSFSKKPGVL